MPSNFVELARAAKSAVVDASGLASALTRHVRGDVRFDDGSRALYATDGSNYRQVPIGIVLPRNADDVIATISLARDFGAPILCRGGGTSLAGQCCNVAVVLDFTKYMAEILEIDPVRRIARVQPGVVLDRLRNAAEQHHLTFGPDPATHDRCTLGGMIGNNSCGVHSVMAGKTDDNIEELEILTYDGLRMKAGQTSDAEIEKIIGEAGRRSEIYAGLKRLRDAYSDLIRKRYPNIPRRVSGYNLNYLLPENGFHVARALVGSEGTCVTVLEASCRLVESPPERVLLVIAYPDIFQCADRVPEIMAHHPIGLEGIDELLIEFSRRRQLNRKDSHFYLQAEAGCSLSSVRTRLPKPSPRHEPSCTLSATAQSRLPCDCSPTRGRQGKSGMCASRLWEPLLTCPVSLRVGRVGKMPPSLPTNSAAICAIYTS